jgi:cytochrome c oxidase subunit II
VRRHLLILGVAWLALTAIGLILIQVEFQPTVASDKGALIDETFKTLLLFSVPVFTFVVAALGYSILAFRHRGDPTEDGAPITGRGPIPLAWFVVTSLMAVGVMVYPGLTELPRVVHLEAQPDVIVKVTGSQWIWSLDYPSQGVKTSKEMVLPVDKTVGFEITATDVVHSVWIPAFRMRIDAVPNLKTYMSFTPTKIGDSAVDPGFRLQCSQMCGGDHAKMTIPVRVVSDADFAAWVKANGTGGSTGPVEGAQQLTLTAANPPGTAATAYTFTSNTLEAKAGTPISITFENKDAGTVHNAAVLTGADPVPATGFEPGPVTQVLNLPALAPGTYQFLCQAHPTSMTGTLEVK